jgi:D-alanine-D-alanine ligase
MTTGMNRKKLRVAVVYGGRSGEHEVSLRSAASVIRHLDASKYEIIPIGIDKQGRWLLNDVSLIEKNSSSIPVHQRAAEPVLLPPNPDASTSGLIRLGAPTSGGRTIDVVFPVMHGTFCEDGTIQGLFELADLPYVGCGVLASAVGMDKEMAKRLARDAGIPIVPYFALKSDRWERDRASVGVRVERELGYPCFVKPSNAGSSVGVHKVKRAADLHAAIEDAFRFDTKILIEKGINAREIEVSVLENDILGSDPLVSTPGEINPTHEFYSYEAKYLDENGAELVIPARLDAAQTREVQRIGREAFEALECEGMARVDMFLDRVDGKLYFNEVNTLPGFTSISMYPKMWEASGMPYGELLDRLIALAMRRHDRKAKLVRDFAAK